MSSSIDSSSGRSVSLVCPHCDGLLENAAGVLRCTECGTSFPVVDGIPRLVEQDFYWGEIDRDSASQFVADANRLGWKEAVAARFAPGTDASISILDWQRASWLPLLALPKMAVVLDVGSGYGAITHALAVACNEVHSVEAIPQRVEFTGARLQQEGLANVHLVQGSALHLPYPAATFDAIVVNGILEWIGDWDPEGDPRSAQLRFLKRIHSLLKPGGVLLVGIENRIAYDSFTGGIDHSGLPYTGLLPRWMATLALRTFGRSHHRMEKPSRSYRTFTYSEPGYRRLFEDAGFLSTDAYWAEPGYNQPYRLTPLDDEHIRASVQEMQLDPFVVHRVGTGGRLKRLLARFGILKYLVPEFVFIVRKKERKITLFDDQLPISIDAHARFRLTTFGFARKTTIRVSSPSAPGLVVQVSTPAPGSIEGIDTEYANLQRVAATVEKQDALSVPVPLGLASVGRQRIAVQSLAKGSSLAISLLSIPAAERIPLITKVLPGVADAAAAVSTVFSPTDDIASARFWLERARPMLDSVTAARLAEIRDRYPMFVAHGDFTIENIMLDQSNDVPSITVIDWESIVRGAPPLYDLMTFYLSLLPTIGIPDDVAARFPVGPTAQAFVAFFQPGPWSELFARILATQREIAELRPSTWDLFMDSLLFRIGYLAGRGSSVAEDYVHIAKLANENKQNFQL